MADQHRSEKSIFLEAIEKTSPAERAAFLEAACGDYSPLRSAVEALLQAHEKPQALLDAADTVAPTLHQPPRPEVPGTVIGPYKLLQQIGEGGMGTVFMAEQTHPVQRKVALKVIKAGMDSRQVIARFEAERQALAMMDHVNIARIYDGGTTAEREEGGGMKRMPAITLIHPSSLIPHPSDPAGPTSSWSWSTAWRSPNTATTTT
jgi:serine/threonine protein kinase